VIICGIRILFRWLRDGRIDDRAFAGFAFEPLALWERGWGEGVADC
jgi:hypothetical protein